MSQNNNIQAVRIQSKCDIKENWIKNNPILLVGEVGYETDVDGRYKIGDGKTNWNNLPYHGLTDELLEKINNGGSDVGGVSEEYVNKKITEKFAEIVDSAPETLNTLNELAQALGDDPNFATTMAIELGNKVDKVEGKGLSTNDLTDELLEKIENTKIDINIENGTGENSIQQITSAATGKNTVALGNSTSTGKLLSYKVIAQNAEVGTYSLESLEGYVDESDFVEVTSGRWEAIVTTATKNFHYIPITSIDIDNCIITVGPENFITFAEVDVEPSLATNLFILRNSNGQIFGNIEIDNTTGDNQYARISGMHAEGEYSMAFGSGSHAEGEYSLAMGVYSHTEGQGSTATGRGAHAEGRYTKAFGHATHAEGDNCIAKNPCSHAEGSDTKAIGTVAHAEGQYTLASGDRSHAEGQGTISSGARSHAEGYNTQANGSCTHAEGQETKANGNSAHAEGYNTIASGIHSHAEGNSTEASGTRTHTEGYSTKAIKENAHAEGNNTQANGANTHAEGYYTIASGGHSHTEGDTTEATGTGAHAEGQKTKASGNYSHAEGQLSQTTGFAAHAENHATASGSFSHAEGTSTASGNYSHSEGNIAKATGIGSHAEGLNTIAAGEYQHVQGKYNTEDTTLAFMIGNGTSASKRSNALTLDWNGNLKISGNLQDMSGNNLIGLASLFIEKNITIRASENAGYGAPDAWTLDTTDWTGCYTTQTLCPLSELSDCDLRYAPIFIPETNDEYGIPFDYEETLNNAEIQRILDRENYVLYFHIDSLDVGQYNDTTWKILFWRKNK